jgi:hypothetical protein
MKLETITIQLQGYGAGGDYYDQYNGYGAGVLKKYTCKYISNLF